MRYKITWDKELVRPIEDLIPGIKTNGLMTLDTYFEGNKPKKDLFEGCGNPDGLDFETNANMFKSNLKIKFGENFLYDQVLVDLGAGFSPHIHGYKMALELGAKGYVGVEPFNTLGLILNLEDNVKLIPEHKRIPLSVVPADMIDFLKRVPDKSISVLCSGIDDFILDYYKRNEVAEEMKRVLSPEGVFLKDFSDINPKLFSVDESHKGILGKHYSGVYIQPYE